LLGSEAGVITAHFPSRCSLSLAALGFCGATYITGWRVKSEILTRQWAHVDFHSGWLRLEPGETKNAEGRQFPLTPRPAVRAGAPARAHSGGRESDAHDHPGLFHRTGRPTRPPPRYPADPGHSNEARQSEYRPSRPCAAAAQ